MKPRFIGLLVGVSTLALATTAMAVSYASGVSQVGTTVSFILNQDAYSVQAILDGGAQTLNLGTSAGDLSFDLGSHSTYQIKVIGNEAPSWNQYIPDGVDNNFYLACGVSINKDPSSANFGKVYVSESQGGTTGAGRTTTSGIYMLRADGVAAGYANGGVDWGAAGNSSPFKSTIGPDGHLYVTDYSNDRAYEFNDDLSVATRVIDDSNRTAGQYVEAIHVEGSQAAGNRQIYTVDSHYLDARVGLIRYDLEGNAAATANDTGTQVIGPGYFSYYPRDVARDGNGDWYMIQYRYNPNEAPAVSKFDGGASLPINAALWETDGAYTGAYGMDINEDAGVVAYGDYYTGYVWIFDLATGDYVDSFDAGSRVRELAFDAAGNLVTVDSTTERARFWSPGGMWETDLGSDGTFTVTMVPEPTTLSLLGLGGLSVLLRRRR